MGIRQAIHAGSERWVTPIPFMRLCRHVNGGVQFMNSTGTRHHEARMPILREDSCFCRLLALAAVWWPSAAAAVGESASRSGGRRRHRLGALTVPQRPLRSCLHTSQRPAPSWKSAQAHRMHCRASGVINKTCSLVMNSVKLLGGASRQCSQLLIPHMCIACNRNSWCGGCGMHSGICVARRSHG